jgi:hypothetical protein
MMIVLDLTRELKKVNFSVLDVGTIDYFRHSFHSCGAKAPSSNEWFKPRHAMFEFQPRP